VLLAHLSLKERLEILPDPLPRFTEKTIVDSRYLEQILAEVKAQGYAITHEEHQEGLSALAAPIYNHAASVVAAVAVSGPTYRLGGDNKIEQFIGPVQDTAREISIQLGCVAI
jgi:DNA-binding IclR family transcriptional regulator